MVKKIIFINLKNNKYARTRNYYHGLLKLKVNCSWRDVAGFRELIAVYKEIKPFRNNTIIVVTSRSQLLSIYSFFLGCRVILDAGLPLWDGVITSRRNFGFMGFRLIKVYLIDFLSFHLAKHVIFETYTQRSRVSKMFTIKQEKLSCVLLGFDENRFVSQNIDQKGAIVKKDVLDILFRGGNQVESGISLLVEACKILEDDKRFTFTLVTNSLGSDVAMNNLRLMVGHISDDLMRDLLLRADLILGQLLNHKRLSIAIPHKFYEAAYFSKPYLTANYGLMEDFVNKNLVFGFTAGDVQSFIKNLNILFEKQLEVFSFGQKLGDWYNENSSQIILTRKFYDILLNVKL
jgi:hypothetical protein